MARKKKISLYWILGIIVVLLLLNGQKKEVSGDWFSTYDALMLSCNHISSTGYVYEKTSGNQIGKWCLVYPDNDVGDCGSSGWSYRGTCNDDIEYGCSSPSGDEGEYACFGSETIKKCVGTSWQTRGSCPNNYECADHIAHDVPYYLDPYDVVCEELPYSGCTPSCNPGYTCIGGQCITGAGEITTYGSCGVAQLSECDGSYRLYDCVNVAPQGYDWQWINRELCDHGCSNGQCNPEPSYGLSCADYPDNYGSCASIQVAVCSGNSVLSGCNNYAPVGYYTWCWSNKQDCANGCLNGECIDEVTICNPEGIVRSCTASNGCIGGETCTNGEWGNCVTTLIKCSDGSCKPNCDGVSPNGTITNQTQPSPSTQRMDAACLASPECAEDGKCWANDDNDGCENQCMPLIQTWSKSKFDGKDPKSGCKTQWIYIGLAFALLMLPRLLGSLKK